MEIRVPRLGEGADTGTVVNVYVKEGDTVKKDQTILELENEKAVAPIPATLGGTVKKVFVKIGDKVAVGQALIDVSGDAAAPVASVQPKAQPPSTGARAAKPVQAQPEAAQEESYEEEPIVEGGLPPAASPSLRKIAGELGIDLRRVKGTERGGRITIDDLRAYIGRLQSLASRPAKAVAGQPPAAAKPVAESIDFSKWGPVTKKPVSSLRKVIAQKMWESWNAIPHVTQFDEADITDLLALRKKHVAAYEKKGAALTLTSFAIQAVAAALKKYPQFNVSLDEATNELILKEYCHIGIAVDTEQGLIVPVLRDADKKNLFDLSADLGKLAEKTRQRKVSVDELKGGSFTISNLGGIGGTHFTPIVNRPEVAILGLGKGVLKPVMKKDKVEGRIMLPVALSYDHRVIDGADGARFIREIVTQLENFPEANAKLK
jgi:pyruvate dehydrogenase E2 component (dihydrolipoamide acetyltransferase)